jgi:CHAT domain-containing protein
MLLGAFGAMIRLGAEEPPRALALLQHALHLADLYNWVDAAPEFVEAEKAFRAASDERGALYAHIGTIRSNAREPLILRSRELEEDLDKNPILQNDKQMRMFCLIVKGDIDGESDHAAMRRDWEEVRALAGELHDSKWENRALGELGLAAFYDGDVETARKNVGTALTTAISTKDIGGEVFFLSIAGNGLVELKMYAQSLPMFDQALKLAAAAPDVGYPFIAHEGRIKALIELHRLDEAQKLVDDMLSFARARQGTSLEASALLLGSSIAQARKDYPTAISALSQSVTLCATAGYPQQLYEAQIQLEEVYRQAGDLGNAERMAAAAASSAQSNGDFWPLPRRLESLAELQAAEGRLGDAEQTYDRAESFVDAMIGRTGALLDKTALIKASSEMYAQHFSLLADRFKNTAKAYSILEQVRGRTETDLLMAGSATSPAAEATEQRVSELRLRLMKARSNSEVRAIRNQIFAAEQSRWVNPDLNILHVPRGQTVSLQAVQSALNRSTVLLEYVMAERRTYCLVISGSGSRIIPIGETHSIESLITTYLRKVKSLEPARQEARELYNALFSRVTEARQKENLIIVRDGPLHFLPFDALVDSAGRYLVESHTVTYAPSASTFYLLARKRQSRQGYRDTLLAFGGIPYKKLTADNHNTGPLADLPGSEDEVQAAREAIQDNRAIIRTGEAATETAFRKAGLTRYRIIHVAAHGIADNVQPDESALVLLSDPKSGDDGLLHASEIVQLRLRADLVILSACDTAVGPVQGEEGVATLSRAFLLAGARSVLSTLWSSNDNFSLLLIRRFYAHLALHERSGRALRSAKLDVLKKFGDKAVPYYWAGFTLEGVASDPIPLSTSLKESDERQSTIARQNPVGR